VKTSLSFLAFAFCFAVIFSNIVVKANDDQDERSEPPSLDELAEADSRLIMEIWESLMTNFVPSDMITVEVPARKTEIVYEDVDALPMTFQGAYFVSSSEDADIDFTIIDPTQKLIFRRPGKKEGIFYFNPNVTGTYTFVFNNRKWLGNKQVTFALNTGKVLGEELVNVKDLTPMEIQLTEADKTLREIQTETRFAYKRQGTHYKTTQANHNKVFYMAIFESLAILTVTIWQVYYIKRLLDNRRII